MRSLKYFLIISILLCSSTTHSSIRLYIAEKDSIESALGVSMDSLWYRQEAYEAIFDGTVSYYDSSEVWLDSVYDIGIPGLLEPPNVFASEIPDNKGARNNYFVVGVADSLVVPETGEYTFVIDANEGMFIMIDDQLLVDADGNVFIYPTLDEAINPSQGTDGFPEIQEYTATITLEAGSHDFKFYFWEKSSSSKASIKWILPSAPGDTVIVPPAAFGIRKNFGPLEAEWIVVGPTPTDDICAYAIYEDTGTVYFGAAARGLMPAETAYYHWEFSIDEGFTGIPEITTTDTVFDTLLERPAGSQGDVIVDYKFWFETNMGRSIPPEGGGSCHVIIFNDTSTIAQRGLYYSKLNIPTALHSSIYNIRGQLIAGKKQQDILMKRNINQLYIIRQKDENLQKKYLLIK